MNKKLWIIFLTIFIDMLGVGILIPVFPLLISSVSQFKVTPSYWSEAQSFIMAGWLLAIYPFCQFIATPILGQLSDLYGRRKLLVFSIFGTAISYALFAYGILSRNLPILFVARALDGISGGNIAIAQAVIGDISEAKARAKNFGLVGVSIGVGFVFGPFLGGKLSDPHLYSWFNAATPFYLATVLSLINMLLVFCLLPETLKVKQTKPLELMKSLSNLKQLFNLGKLKAIIIPLFFFNAGWTFFTTFWGVVLMDQFAFSQSRVGDFFAYFGVMIILAQGGVVRRLSGKIAETKAINFALILVAISLFVYYILPRQTPIWAYCVPPFLAIGAAMTKAFSSALITKLSTNETLGEAMGINSSAQALAQTIPSLLSGYVAAHYARLPVLVGAVLVFVAWLVFRYAFKSQTCGVVENKLG